MKNKYFNENFDFSVGKTDVDFLGKTFDKNAIIALFNEHEKETMFDIDWWQERDGDILNDSDKMLGIALYDALVRLTADPSTPYYLEPEYISDYIENRDIPF